VIGQITQSVVIGLLCSDWSDDPVCCDRSTLVRHIGQTLNQTIYILSKQSHWLQDQQTPISFWHAIMMWFLVDCM